MTKDDDDDGRKTQIILVTVKTNVKPFPRLDQQLPSLLVPVPSLSFSPVRLFRFSLIFKGPGLGIDNTRPKAVRRRRQVSRRMSVFTAVLGITGNYFSLSLLRASLVKPNISKMATRVPQDLCSGRLNEPPDHPNPLADAGHTDIHGTIHSDTVACEIAEGR